MAVTPNSIITPQTPRTATCVLTTASTDIDDAPTTPVQLMTAGAAGARLNRLAFLPRATVTATMIQVYLKKNGSPNYRLIESVLINAFTVANTTEIPTTDAGYSEDNPLILEALDEIHVATSVSLAGGIVAFAQYQDY